MFFFFPKFDKFRVPGPLRTAFELNNWFAYVKNTPDAITLTLHALNLLKRPKNINQFFSVFQFFYFVQICISWGPHSLTRFVVLVCRAALGVLVSASMQGIKHCARVHILTRPGAGEIQLAQRWPSDIRSFRNSTDYSWRDALLVHRL